MELIHSDANNKTFAEIAKLAGFSLGQQLPSSVSMPIDFCDQDWKNPNLTKYAEAIKEKLPRLATVLDFEKAEQLPLVLEWAETIAPYMWEIIIIPKVIGSIKDIPRRVGGKGIRLGYSVPTSYGGTTVPYAEFRGWPVHLLGGRPVKQKRLCHFMNVVSVDGNYAAGKARRWCQYFYNGKWIPEGKNITDGAHHACFRQSCYNIMAMWHGRENKPLYGENKSKQMRFLQV